MKARKSIKDGLYRAAVSTAKNTFSVTFPPELREYLGVDGEELYWVPANGTIQLTGKKPSLMVPALPFAGAAEFQRL